MIRPAMVEALTGFHAQLSYSDGVQGVLDLSTDVGRKVFGPLAGEACFRAVHIGDHGQIAWSADIEVGSYAAYEEFCGMPAEAAHA